MKSASGSFRSPVIHSSKSAKSALPVFTRRSARSPKPGGNSKSKQNTPCSTPPRAGSPPLTETPKLAIKTKLQLVDLAGSECVGRCPFVLYFNMRFLP